MKLVYFLASPIAKKYQNYVRLAALAIASARKHMRDAHIVHLTDMDTPALTGVDEVMRVPTSRRALAHSMVDGEVIFIDVDTIIKKDVSHVLDDKSFDIAVSRRRNVMGTHNEFNSGVVFSRCQKFWSHVHIEWEKDNYAFNEHAFNTVIHGGQYRVAYLDATYNYTPKSDTEDVSMANIVHYKGKRKAWMLQLGEH